MDALSTTLAIFTAMLTPVVLISAGGSLTLSTSNRLSRAVDRARKLGEVIEQLSQTEVVSILIEERRALTYFQLHQITERSRLLHRALTSLYLSLSCFVVTSVALGVVAYTNSTYSGIPLLLGTSGVGLMFYASLLLIAETRIARKAIDAEMNFMLRMGKQFAPNS